MNQKRQALINFILILLISLILVGLQSATWFRLFSSVIAPLVWLDISLYLMLYRKPLQALAQIYILCIFWRAFTATPIGLLWSIHLVLFALVMVIKKRVFWPGVRYFLISALGVSLAYEIAFPLLGLVFEPRAASFNFLYRFSEIFLTTCMAAPVFLILSKVDELTHIEQLPETAGSFDL